MTDQKDFRVFTPNTTQHDLYKEMYKHQTYDYVEQKLTQYNKFNHGKFTVQQVLSMMNSFVDPSDPDLLAIPNSVHAYQTAERIRKAYPKNYEMQICGLIHDLGKILYHFGEPGYNIVGDTYVVGCQFAKSIVYYDDLINLNSDYDHVVYGTPNGIYKPGCGIENLTLSFGHDEYLYQVLCHNKSHMMTNKYMNVIRFHSFYPWHTGGDYRQFMKPSDNIILQDVLEFNQYDLYSKGDDQLLVSELNKTILANEMSASNIELDEATCKAIYSHSEYEQSATKLSEMKQNCEILLYYNDLLDLYFPEPLKW